MGIPQSEKGIISGTHNREFSTGNTQSQQVK